MPAHKVAAVSEIPVGEGRCVEVEGHAIAVFNVGGNFHAIDNSCPHRGGPLADGPVSGTMVTCPWHGWQFDCTSGQSSMNPTMGVTVYKASVDGDDVFIEL